MLNQKYTQEICLEETNCCMNSKLSNDEFIKLYWKNYILIEREFIKTLEFVELSEDNANTYSNAYLKLMLELGSEIDVVMGTLVKLLCNRNGFGINNRINALKSSMEDFCTQQVIIEKTGKVLVPWGECDESEKSPSWWKVYNKIKHERNHIFTIDSEKKEAYKFANQKYVIVASTALYQLLINLYIQLDSNNKKIAPIPGSKIFKMHGNEWDEMKFFGEFGIEYDESNGNLYFLEEFI